MSPIQFDLRVEAYKTTIQNFVVEAITNAGYSPQTFGYNIEGYAQSGTALNIRERKTLITRSKKQEYFKRGISDICETLLMIDNAIFSQSNIIEKPNIDFQDNQNFDISQTSSTIETLNRAVAISNYQKVKMAHPNWTEQMIIEEVNLIMVESGMQIQDNESEVDILGEVDVQDEN